MEGYLGIEVIVYKKISNNPLYLIMKRVPECGGFWQHITGALITGESFEEAALRELEEETGIVNPLNFYPTERSFSFQNNGTSHFMEVFGAEVNNDTEIVLSREHEDFKWLKKKVALEDYLSYQENKDSLVILSQTLVL